MILKRFYEESLAHASYLVGCPGAGDALIIDPGRNVDAYVTASAKEGLRIAAVTETHIHADLLSGSRELAARTGARLYLSDEGGPDWTYAFAEPSGAILVRDGYEFRVGSIRIQVRHTPGHTPEHISFILTDEATSPEPAMVFTGDFVFVGDVGRPDLLEALDCHPQTRQKPSHRGETAARSLYRSLAAFKRLPEHLLIWPAHGAGSACGKSLGGVPVASLGYELRTNWALRGISEDGFVREVLSGQPEPPAYFARMKQLNKEGPPWLRDAKRPSLVSEIPRFGESANPPSQVIVDIRPPEEFARIHAPGAINMPLYKSFVTWAGWLLPYDRELHLIGDTPEDVEDAVQRLSLIGFDRVVSWSNAEVLGLLPETQSYRQGSFEEGVPEGSFILDVRSSTEWGEGHVPGATHIPLGSLPRRLDELPRDKAIAVHCQGGGRSPIATSILQAAGFKGVVDLIDGYIGYEASERACRFG